MKTVAVDTNVLVTYLIGREPDFKTTKQLFQQCLEGKLRLFIALPVFLETEWVLRSFYQQPKETIIKFFDQLLLINNLITDDNDNINFSLNLYKNSSISFTDCIIIKQVHSREYDFLTFDKDLEKFFQSL